MKKFYSQNYRNGKGWFAVQEYMLGSYAVFLGLYGMIIIYMLARHTEILIPGLVGGFATIILANYFGLTNARSHFVEIGFSESHFYLKSAYDAAFNQNLKLYPIAYSNVVVDKELIFLNYIDHTIRLRTADWPEWQEVYFLLRNAGTGESNISFTYP